MGEGKNNIHNITAHSILLTSTRFLQQHHIFLSTSKTTTFLFYNSALQREIMREIL